MDPIADRGRRARRRRTAAVGRPPGACRRRWPRWR